MGCFPLGKSTNSQVQFFSIDSISDYMAPFQPWLKSIFSKFIGSFKFSIVIMKSSYFDRIFLIRFDFCNSTWLVTKLIEFPSWVIEPSWELFSIFLLVVNDWSKFYGNIDPVFILVSSSLVGSLDFCLILSFDTYVFGDKIVVNFVPPSSWNLFMLISP